MADQSFYAKFKRTFDTAVKKKEQSGMTWREAEEAVATEVLEWMGSRSDKSKGTSTPKPGSKKTAGRPKAARTNGNSPQRRTSGRKSR